ncbi:Hypothetical protein A7982_08982 [Minicystis rosea]|nr:Hypothetical protein A7982_08982 [Minicystis rosea]
MTTFELWSAIERGEVAAWMRVWREGLECWTPLGELPELQWAVANANRMAAKTAIAPAPSLETATPEPTPESPLSEPLPPQAITPEPIAPVAKQTTKDTARAVSRLSRGAVPESEPAPVSEARPKVPASRWVLAGSAVASLAIAAALLHATLPSARSTDPRSVSAAELPKVTQPADPPAGAHPSPPSPLPETSPEAETALAEPQAPSGPPAARREDRGQRRMSRSGRRAR